MTDAATRAALAALEGAAIERLGAELARAEDLARALGDALRALHTDHDSDVAALRRARDAHAAHATHPAGAREIAASARRVEALRELSAARREEVQRAEAELREAEAAAARARHELAQRIARRAAYTAPRDVTDEDDER